MRGTCRWCGSEVSRIEYDESMGNVKVLCLQCMASGPVVTVNRPVGEDEISAAKEEAWRQWCGRGAHWPNDNRTNEVSPTEEDADADGYVMVMVWNEAEERSYWQRVRWIAVANHPNEFPVWRAWPGKDEQPKFGQERPEFGSRR